MSSAHERIRVRRSGGSAKTPPSSALIILAVIFALGLLLALDIQKALTLQWPLNIALISGPVILIVVFFKPIIGIGMLIALVYIDALQRVQGTQFSAMKVVFALTLFSSIIIFLMRKIEKPRTPIDLPTVAFGAMIFLTLMFGHNDYYHVSVIIRVSTFIIISLLMNSLIKDERTLRIIIYIMVAGAVISSSVGLAQYALKGEVVTKIYPDRGYGEAAAAGQATFYTGRSTGMTLNANHFAFMLMIVVPLLIALPHSFKKEMESKFLKLALMGSVYILCAGILLSQSRTTLMETAAIMTIMSAAAPGRHKLQYGFFYVLVPLIVGVFLLFGMGLYHRTAIEEDESVSIRFYDNFIVRDIIMDKPSLIITGAGFSGYARLAPPYQAKYGVIRLPVLHSDYIRLFFEFGILSFLALVALWGTAIVSSFRSIGRAPPDKKYLMTGFFMSIISICVFIFFHTETFGAGSWYILGLFSAAYSIFCKPSSPPLPEKR